MQTLTLITQLGSLGFDLGQHFVIFLKIKHASDYASIPGARFSKVPKLFGRISDDLILFVSSKWRRLEARNFAVILIVIPFTSHEKNSFTELAGRSFTNSFSGPKSFRDFRETGPRT